MVGCRLLAKILRDTEMMDAKTLQAYLERGISLFAFPGRGCEIMRR